MSSSLFTNSSAMTALQVMRQVDHNMATTQRQMSTGLRVSQASDNSAYWSISTLMRSDMNALGAVSDSMKLGKAQVDTAYQSVDRMRDPLDKINQSLTEAIQKGDTDVKKLQKDIKGQIEDIRSAVYSAGMAEKNIIANNGHTEEIPGAYRRVGNNVYVDMIEVGGANLNFAKQNVGADGKFDGTFDLSQGVLKSIFGTSTAAPTPPPGPMDSGNQVIDDALKAFNDAVKDKDASKPDDKKAIDDAKATLKKIVLDAGVSVSDFANANLEGIDSRALSVLANAMQEQTTTAVNNVLTAGSELGAVLTRVQGQVDFVSKLQDSFKNGIGALVDADMSQVATQLQALQVQQQLATQTLAIANSNTQGILTLFRNM